MGTTRLPSLVTQQLREGAHEACVVLISRPSAVGSSTALKVSSAGTVACSSALVRRCGTGSRRAPCGARAGNASPACRRPACRTGSRQAGRRDRHVEAVAEGARPRRSASWSGARCSCLAALAHAEALDRLDQQHGGLAPCGSWRGGRPRRPCAGRGRRGCRRQMSSSLILATISFSSGVPKKFSRTKAPSLAFIVW